MSVDQSLIEAIGIFAVCVIVVCCIAAMAASEYFKNHGLPDDDGSDAQ